MLRLFALATTSVLLILTVACGRESDGDSSLGDPQAPVDGAIVKPSEGCGSTADTGISVGTIDSDGLIRSYRLYIPSSYDANAAMPLLLNFHGFGSNGVSQEAYSGLAEVAEREGFVLVSPDGTGSPPQWHIYGRLLPGFVDDYAFVERLLDHLEVTLCVDKSRVYAAGLSNGGGMAQALGCRLNDRIAAVGSVAGAPFNDAACTGKEPMPVIAFHGTADEVVAFEGEGSLLGLNLPPVRTTMQQWAEHNGCEGEIHSERTAEDVVREAYDGCDESSAVQLYVIEGGGHTWPGALDRPGLGRITKSISASDLMWQFFEAHPGGP
jgi:polyhydroxybutyrate depolymerase